MLARHSAVPEDIARGGVAWRNAKPWLAAVSVTVVLLCACGENGIELPEGPVGLALTYGDEQIRWPGAALINDLGVQTVDEDGNEIQRAGIPITWSVVSGGGAVVAASGVSDGQGRATASWTLGPDLGTQSVEAQAESQRTVVFTARAAQPGPLLFVSDRTGRANNLFLMNEDGNDVMQLASMGSDISHPAWSPDGLRIAAIRDYDELVLLDADGSNLQTIADDAVAWIEHPTWSLDGSRIAFAIRKVTSACQLFDHNIYTIDSVGNGLVQLTDGCETIDTEPDWSPDGSKIVFVSRRDARKDVTPNLRDPEVYVMNADGSDQTRLTYNGGERDDSPVWMPAGDGILFVRWVQVGGYDGTSSLWRMNPDGTAKTLVKEFDGIAAGLELSPDGLRLLLDIFQADPADTDLYVLDMQTLELQLLTESGWSSSWRAQ